MGVIILSFVKGILKISYLQLVTGIIGFLGAIFLMVGLTTPNSVYPNNSYHPGRTFLHDLYEYNNEYFIYTNTTYGIIYAIAIGILLISLFTILGSIIPKLDVFSKLNPLFIILFIFFLVPMFIPNYYFSPVKYLTFDMTDIASDVAYWSMRDVNESVRLEIASGFIHCIIAIVTLVIAFFMSTISIFKKYTERQKSSEEIREMNIFQFDVHQLYQPKNIFNIILSIFAVILGIGIMNGLNKPYYDWEYRGTPPIPAYRNPSFLRPERLFYDGENYHYKNFVDISAVLYLLIALCVVLASIMLFLSSFQLFNPALAKGSLVFFSAILLFLPLYTIDFGWWGEVWYPSFVQIFMELNYIFYQATSTGVRFAQGDLDYQRIVTSDGNFLYSSMLMLLVVFVLCIGSLALSFKKQEEFVEPIVRPERRMVVEVPEATPKEIILDNEIKKANLKLVEELLKDK